MKPQGEGEVGLLILNARCGGTKGHSERRPATPCIIPTQQVCLECRQHVGAGSTLSPQPNPHQLSLEMFSGSQQRPALCPPACLGTVLVLAPSSGTSAFPRAVAAGAYGLCQSQLCGHGAARGIPQPHNNWRRVLLFNILGIFCQG